MIVHKNRTPIISLKFLWYLGILLAVLLVSLSLLFYFLELEMDLSIFNDDSKIVISLGLGKEVEDFWNWVFFSLLAAALSVFLLLIFVLGLLLEKWLDGNQD